MKQRMNPSPDSVCALRRRRSRFIEIFRTTPARTVCPNFHVLAHANGCTFRPQCEYCYLKSSLWHLDRHEAFTNLAQMLGEVRRWVARDGLESYVLNAGNLSDSLAFERVRPVMSRLVDVFREAEAAGRPHTLLLVTKGGVRECRALLDAAPCANVIVSFSVNRPDVARRHERGAPAVSDRLDAARRLKDGGWRVRIRIDPMFAGQDYRGVARQVRRLRPERVTLGSLRAEPHLLRIVRNGMFSALEEPSEKGGLARYPLAARLELYRPAVEALKDLCPIGLCEETRDVWDALGLDAEARSCNCGF
jgi:DNA repair photolyase